MKPDCKSCPLAHPIDDDWKPRGYKSRYFVPNEIVPTAPIVFVAMAPATEEMRQGRPLAPRELGKGRLNAGALFKTALEDHDIHRGRDCSILNVIGCAVPKNEWSLTKRKGWPSAIKCCSPLFQDDLRKARGKVIVTLGEEPLKELDTTAKGKRLGKLRGHLRGNILPTYHPAFFLRTPSQKVLDDFHYDLAQLEEYIDGSKRRKPSKHPAQVSCITRSDKKCRREDPEPRRQSDAPGRSSRVHGKETQVKWTFADPCKQLPANVVLDIEHSVGPEVDERTGRHSVGPEVDERTGRRDWILVVGFVRIPRACSSTRSFERETVQLLPGDVLPRHREAFSDLERLVAHNAPFDFFILRREGLLPYTWEGRLDCTMAMHSLIDENIEAGLKTFATRHGFGNYWSEVEKYWKLPTRKAERLKFLEEAGYDLGDRDWKDVKSIDPPPEVLYPYNACDVALTVERLAECEEILRGDEHLWNYYENFLRHSVRLAAEIKLNGIYIHESAKAEEPRLRRRVKWRRDEILKLAGEPKEKFKRTGARVKSELFQRDLLFRQLQIEPKHFTEKTKEPSLSRDHLEELRADAEPGTLQHHVLTRYFELSTLDKQYSDLVNHLIPNVDTVIHPDYNIGGTGAYDDEAKPVVTGRWSSSGQSNPQQYADYLKRHCRSRYRDGFIGQWDTSQMEVRGAYINSRDPEIKRLFVEGIDPYIQSATDVYGEEKAKPRRFMGKRTFLAGLFGVHWEKLMNELNGDCVNLGFPERVDEAGAKYALNLFYERFPIHMDWIRRIKKQVQKDGFVRAPTGRIRHLPLAKVGDFHALNQAINFPIQGPCSDFNVLAALLLGARFKRGRLITLVHDSGVVDVEDDAALAWFFHKIRRIWSTTLPRKAKEIWGIDIDIPLAIEVSFGRAWSPLTKVPADANLETLLKEVPNP